MNRTGSMRLARRPGGDDDLQALAARRLTPRSDEHLVGDLRRLEHAADADFAAGLLAARRPEDAHATLLEQRDVRLSRGVRPHLAIHRGRDA